MNTRLNLPEESDLQKVLRLETGRLPSFPQAAAKLIKMSRDDTASLKDLAKILETDPGLSVQVLKIVNSPVYGLNRTITTLSDAVVLLGMDQLRKQALSMSLFRQMVETNRFESFDLLFFWRHILSVAVLSHEIAKAVHYPDPEEAYIGGLLHDVGKLCLLLQGRVDYAAFIRNLPIGTGRVIEAEARTVGMGHDEVGAWFCDRWALPEKLTAVVRYHHQPFGGQAFSDTGKTLIALVSLADFLCWTQGIGSFDFIHTPVLVPEVSENIELGQSDIIDAIMAMNREMESISAHYDFVFPTAGELHKNLLSANLALSKINTRYFFQMGSLNQLKTSDDALSPDQGRELEFGKSFSRARSVKEVLDIVMDQIGRIFKPRHWSILLKNHKSEDLVFSIVIGENRQTLQGLTLAKGEGIAGYIMKTGRPLVVEDVSKEPRFSSWADTFTGFQTRSVIGAPLKTGEKIFGVIELINRIEESPFTQKDLALFTSIAEYAAIAIERSYYTQNLTRLATRDSLTGVLNRWSFERTLGRRNEFRIRYGDPFSMLIIRMEKLDRLIRSGGQPAWEDAVNTLARVLQAAKRKNDSLFRYSDTIFLLLLPQTGSAEAKTCRHRIEQAVQTAEWEDPRIPGDIHMVHHTLSSDGIEKLISLLEEALPAAGTPPVSEAIPDISETLQPLVAREIPEEPVQEKVSKKFGKAVSLMGHALSSTTKTRVSIKVARISMTAIGFRVHEPGKIFSRDLLHVQFALDDLKRSVIKRQVRVLEVDETYVYGTFYNPPPYDKALGFYVLS